MRSEIFSILLLLYLFSGDVAPDRAELQESLRELNAEAAFCRNRTFGVNTTYPIPPSIQETVDDLFKSQEMNDKRAHFYHNATGSFKGSWGVNTTAISLLDTEMPLPPAPVLNTSTSLGPYVSVITPATTATGATATPTAINNTVATPTPYGKRPEGFFHDSIADGVPKHMGDVDKYKGQFRYNESGSFVFNIWEERLTEAVHYVQGHWRFKHDDNQDYGVSLDVIGVHFVHNGSFYMWAVPSHAWFPLAHILDMMPDNATFLLAKEALNERYKQRVTSLENVIAGIERPVYSEASTSELSSCQFQMFMQLGGISPAVKPALLSDLEKEWASPSGISVISAPHLNASLVLFSPNCRLAMGIKDTEGMKREKFLAKAVNYAAMAGTVAFIQVFLLVRQMEYTPTPSSVSKVSYWTIAIQVFMDTYLCMIHLTTAVSEFLFIPFVAASFFSFVLVSIFGMRYLLVIWRIQRPERRGRRQRNNTAGATPATPATAVPAAGPVDTMPGGLPLPVTAARAPAPDPDSPRSDLQAVYGRFYWMICVSLFAIYKIATSSTYVQNLLIGMSAAALFSFWIPQIVRNAIRGSKKGLSLWFVLGMSLTRLVGPLYFYTCPDNLLGHEPTRWVWVLVAWVGLQVSVLLLQDWLGPRFFIPKQYLPPTYDYHPILPVMDEESSGSAPPGTASGHQHRHAATRDCAICMLPIEVGGEPGVLSQATGVSTSTSLSSSNPLNPSAVRISSVVGSLGRLNYMMTPCGHLFHTDCLEKWMRIKLECPNCRSFLPSA